MPELPDITVYLEALEKRILGERLLKVRINSPFLLRTFDPPLEAGMVINFETPWSEIGVGGYQHEVTVLVTASGCELLSPKREYRVV